MNKNHTLPLTLIFFLLLIILRVNEYKKPVPGYGKFYTALGQKYENKGQWDKALQSYNRAIRNNPQYRDAYYFLGKLSANLGDSQAGLSNFHKVIELGPDQEKIKLQLQKSDVKNDVPYAYACYQVGIDAFNKKDIDGAIGFWEKAFEHDGTQLDAVVRLGEAYLIKGKKEAAFMQYKILSDVQQWAYVRRMEEIFQKYDIILIEAHEYKTKKNSY